MGKRLFSTVGGLLAFGLVLSLSTQAEAARARHTLGRSHSFRHGKKRPPPKPQYESIGSVNTSAGTVTIVPKNSASKQVKTLRAAPDCVITVNGRRGRLSDLQTGMKVVVGLGMDADVATELTVTDAPK